MSCSISADGKTAIVAGYDDTTSGSAYVWQYNKATHTWGKYNSDGTFEPRTDNTFIPHDLSKTSGANGNYGISCSLSADGKTALVAGYSSTTSGELYLWQYDEATHTWGRHNSDGGFSPRTSGTFIPHDLSKTSDTNGYYGMSCSISMDGLTVLVTGNTGGAWVWRGVDQGERAQMSISGASYASLLPLDQSGIYKIAMGATDVSGVFGVGKFEISDAVTSIQAVDRSVQGVSSNSSLTTEKLEFVFDFDSDETPEYNRYIGKVVLSNGDAFYGPRYGYTSSYQLTSVGNFTNGNTYPYSYSINNDKIVKHDSITSTTDITRAWVFYYEPSKPSLINKVSVQVNTSGSSNKEYITKIGKVSTTNEFETATNIYMDGSSISLDASVRLTGDFVLTFDAILAGPNEPVKLVLGMNNNTLKNLDEVTFEFDGDINDYSHFITRTFSPAPP